VVQKPDAPTRSVDIIIKAFRGTEERGGTDGWLVGFDNDSDEQHALLLINMLQGWRAEPYPNCRCMIQIEGV